MVVDVLFQPRDLHASTIADRSVAVVDVLRATTTITSALAARIRNVRVFSDIKQTIIAAQREQQSPLLCGEVNCLPPAGFDLGNSPGQFRPSMHAGRQAFLVTTNGTQAIAHARSAPLVVIAAIINASAVAKYLLAADRDIIILCSGTSGRVAMEDLICAGAVANSLVKSDSCELGGDNARIAHRLFLGAQDDLAGALRDSQGGRNIVAAGLDEDIDFAARLDALDIVGVVRDNALNITADKSL